MFKTFTMWLLTGPFLVMWILGSAEALRKFDWEHKLIADLFLDYEKDARPLYNKSEAIDVTLDIAYSQLVDLDGKNQILSSKVWIRQVWSNPFLSWDPNEYGGLDSINVDAKLVWKPDIILYNNIGIGQTGAMYNFDTKVVIDYDGTNSWFAPTEIKSICQIDITYFPFDTQTCPLIFGSWTYSGKYLNLLMARNQSDLSKYTISGEWDLLSAPVVRHVVKYSCCKYPYIDVTYTIHVRRKVLFYLNNLILPCMVLAILTVSSFFLPPASGERISLVITILLGLTVFMLVFTESVPRTSEVIPLIAKYSFAVMCEVAISLLLTCFVMRIYHKGEAKKMPVSMRYLVYNILAPIVRLHPIQKGRNLTDDRKDISGHDRKYSSFLSRGPFTYITKTREDAALCCDSRSTDKLQKNSDCEETMFPHSETDNKSRSSSEEKMDELCHGIYSILDHLKQAEVLDDRRNEWHFAAIVFDKVFFWLFAATMVVSTSVFYFQIPSSGIKPIS